MGRDVATKNRRKNTPQPLDYSKELWLQQDGETDKAYEEFIQYRDSDERRTRDYSNGFYNSVRWSWQERVKSWDDHLAQKEAEKMIRYRIDMNDRHRAIGRLAQSRAAQWLRGLTEERINAMRPLDVVKMLEIATKLERDAAQGDRPDMTIETTSRIMDMTADNADRRLDQLLEELHRRRQAVAGDLVDEGELEEEERNGLPEH